jgi:uncharacterized protein YllA (UPF0747 family)
VTLPRIITEPLGGGPLALAAQRGEHDDWYLSRPEGVDSWREYLRQVAAGHRREAWVAKLGPALAAEGLAKARLQRVLDGEGVVISTGQQAALFGGPLYTLLKALSALAIADVLERETGVPTVPVFWAATDDADFEEAKWAAVVVPGGVRKLELPPLQRSGLPMNDVPLPDVERLIEGLADACGAAVEPAILDVVRASYVRGTTLGRAYLRQLRELLQPLGIAVLDASHATVRLAAEPLLVRSLDGAAKVEQALRERYEAIRAAGYHPQVEHLPTLTLVFARGLDGDKRRIPIAEAGRIREHENLSLSPNVLLRPLVERYIMPSAAYVAGPGELSYFAQLSAAAKALDTPTPLALSRWSATILEPRVERLLQRLGANREELRDRHALERRLARGAMPEQVRDALLKLRSDVDADIARLGDVDRDKLVPAASLEGLRRAVIHRLERTERRYVAGLKRHETDLMRDISTAAAALYPEGNRQERMLNFVPFLARYGQPLLDAMRAEAEGYARDVLTPVRARTAQALAERV